MLHLADWQVVTDVSKECNAVLCSAN